MASLRATPCSGSGRQNKEQIEALSSSSYLMIETTQCEGSKELWEQKGAANLLGAQRGGMG
jgi:hypothetical protein